MLGQVRLEEERHPGLDVEQGGEQAGRRDGEHQAERDRRMLKACEGTAFSRMRTLLERASLPCDD